MIERLLISFFFFFNDTATTEIYTLSLHDALPIWERVPVVPVPGARIRPRHEEPRSRRALRRRKDRKSTRLNSSHSQISYAVFCLKKKKKELSHTFEEYKSQHQHTHNTAPDELPAT